MIIVDLTKEQEEQLKPLMEKITEMSKDGKPGMVVCQLYKDHLACATLGHESAVKLLDALGCEREQSSTAYGRSDYHG